ncbi:MAG: DUF4982 domain-containing protein [Balneolaceae bacterium]|nr:DUF4982 domain-containing protein [Balneolaceae bacterium]
MYQSEWTEKDVLHIFPLWNWQKDDTVDIWAYSSTYDVELFLNDQSLGRKMNPVGQYHIRWRVLLESGIIRAASYNKMEKRFLRKRSIPREYYPELNSPRQN